MVYTWFFDQDLLVTRSHDFDVFQAVFQGAERIAAEITKAYEDGNYGSTIETNDNVDVGEQEIAIANWDWLDFGDKANLD